MDTSEVKRSEIVDLHRTGRYSTRQISSIVNVPRATVNRIINLWNETGNVRSRRYGRTPTRTILSERTRRYIVRHSRADPQLTAREIQNFQGGEASNVSVRHIRRVLNVSGRVARRPVTAPQLNSARKRVRLNWAKQHEHWTTEDWAKVSFY